MCVKAPSLPLHHLRDLVPKHLYRQREKKGRKKEKNGLFSFFQLSLEDRGSPLARSR